jgi:pescadillo protein
VHAAAPWLTRARRAWPLRRQASTDASGHLFRGCVFFLGRETPRDALSFLIRACGGVVAWDGAGSAHAEDDAAITHQVVDRPAAVAQRRPGREYVQPQWLFDSLNFRIRCPAAPYAPGVAPPPHLSPFVADASADGYSPDFADTVRARGRRARSACALLLAGV